MADKAIKTVAGRQRGGRARAPPSVRRFPSSVSQGGAVAGGSAAVRLVQPALKVGALNDPMEREAETMAERVVAMPRPQMAWPEAAGDAAGSPRDAMRTSADDQPNTDTLEADPPIPDDHLDPEVPPVEDVDTPSLGSADMNEIETGQPTDTAGDPPLPEPPSSPGGRATGDDTAMPARGEGAVVGAEGGPAPPDVARRVADPGAGRPLPRAVREFMEPRFDRDFSGVRIHDAPDDHRIAHRIGARAFTHRDHVWIGPGESVSDRKLMAHELTHVVQQTGAEPAKAAARVVAAAEPALRRGYIRNKAEKYARNIPGYRLICLIIGKSPITGDTVERNAVNVLGAMMSLIPGGNLLFERLEETRVIEEAFEWVWTRLLQLNITWTRIKGLVSDLIDYLPDWPSDVIDYAIKLFKPLVDDILTFIKDVVKKILEFIVRGALKLAGPWGEKVWEIIQAAGAVLMTILEDPLGFAKNLFAAVVRGFKQFGSNIWEHIKSGLLAWLFGTLEGLDLQMPERLDFKGLISIGLQIVGLTYANFRAIMVKKLGANGERKMAFIEKSVEAVRLLVKEGFAGLWQRVFQMIDNFRATVIGGIRDFVIKQLIMGGISWLAGLSNPIGAVVKVVLSIYNMIVTFLERLDQILEVARSIFSSIGAIAAGRIQEAADFVERTMARTIPIVVSFLAALVPVTGIVNSIRGIIAKLRGAVKGAIEKLVGFVAKKAKKLFSKLIAKLNAKRKLPSANFKIGDTPHRMFAEKAGAKVDIFVQSNKMTSDEALAGMQQQVVDFKTKASPETLKEVIAFINTFKKEETDAEKKADKVNPSSQKEPALKTVEDLKKELAQGSERLTQLGLSLADNGDVLTTDPSLLIRYQRSSYALEGAAGIYSELEDQMKGQKHDGMEASTLYERDHIPGQAPLQILKQLSEGLNAGAGGAPTPVRDGPETPPAKEGADAASPAPLGAFHKRMNAKGTNLRAIVIDRKFNLRGGATQKNDAFQEALNKKKPDEQIAAAETAIAQHVEARANQIAGEYEKIEDKDTRTRVQAGLTRIREFAKTDFGLGSAIKAEQPDIKAPAPGKGRSASIPFSDPKNPAERNFADGEGQSGPYRPTRTRYKNDLLEFDHVLDSSFAFAVQDLNANKIWAPALAKIKDATKGNEEAARRKDELSRTKLFRSSALKDYSKETSLAVGIFLRVNDRVSGEAKTYDQAKAGERIASAVRSDSLESMVSFVADGKVGPSQAVEAARADAKSAIDQRFREHGAVIERAYEAEKIEVAKANAEPAARKAAAEAQMNFILARVKTSLRSMSDEKDALFK
ncbi:DUF4157 domain-containing protein [Ancylobacter sp. Lp-2]|uniref:eCIS core domain-containing protein n=1 Tax=Ancylobacter sp. Lp-2 TaxID=2881339 RepID=UPI001E2D035D|nr:DUF4157 domain-containing protein [Ancylobacter sp. Lp-2]MCB4768060.1 DUF4157 domain-containing protein [Ancylobacter sp. Lp-2]